MLEQLTTFIKLHHKVKLLWCLKSIFQSRKEWMVDIFKNVSFCFCMFNLIFFDYNLFFDHFNSKEFSGIFFLTEHNFAKSTSSNDFEDVEIVNSYFYFLAFKNCSGLIFSFFCYYLLDFMKFLKLL